jgi:transposase
MALELSLATWKLAFTVGSGQKPRIRSVPAGALLRLMDEIRLANKRFGLPEDAAVISCYEAGRDGFWIHRFLVSQGIQNIVVDSASIEVNRRKRRAKSDRLDAVKLASMLIRWHNGEKEVWAAVRVPTVGDEDRRQLHRELIDLKAQRT